MVVGSQDGQIRLYNGKQFTRANTAVPGLGAPITSVDVTYDGKWILATTKSYLMVVKTIYKVKPLVTDCMHAARVIVQPLYLRIDGGLPCIAAQQISEVAKLHASIRRVFFAHAIPGLS